MSLLLAGLVGCGPLVVSFPGDGSSDTDLDRGDTSGDTSDTRDTSPDTSGDTSSDTSDTDDTSLDTSDDTGCGLWFPDADGDGYGATGAGVTDCTPPDGYVADGTDCDDGAAGTHPGATDLLYDGIDQDCDGLVDTVDTSGSGWTIVGDATNDGIGSGGAFGAADLDGDGYPEMVVAAPLYGPNDTGAIAIHGSDTAALEVSFGAGLLIDGAATRDRFGASMILVDDVDGDGYAELVAGAPLSNQEEGDDGAVYVFEVNHASSGTPVDGIASAVHAGAGSSEYAGSSLSAGDLTGDGVPELVVGADGEDGGRGAVYILYGETAWWREDSTLGSWWDDGVRGDDSGDGLGTAVLATGDLTGDGYADMVLCAGNRDGGRGACWVVHRNWWDDDENQVDDVASATLTGSAADDAVGDTFSVAAADLDGDGTDDLVLGAPGYDGASTDGGAVAVWFGGRLSGESSVDDADLLLTGDGAAGRALAVGPDRDGVADLYVGAPDANAVYLLAGLAPGSGPLSAASIATRTSTSAGFGSALAANADLDADGTFDLSVAATAADGSFANAGRVFHLTGAP